MENKGQQREKAGEEEPREGQRVRKPGISNEEHWGGRPGEAMGARETTCEGQEVASYDWSKARVGVLKRVQQWVTIQRPRGGC